MRTVRARSSCPSGERSTSSTVARRASWKVLLERKASKREPSCWPPRGGQQEGSLFDAFLSSKTFQDALRATVLDVLRSPEGQELLARTVRKELSRQR